MASFYKDGSKIVFEGIKGEVIKITETYRKNVLVVRVTELPKKERYPFGVNSTIGLFEYPTGMLEFMSVID